VIPANSFTDADTVYGDTLTYAVTGALPSWLSFNAATRTFSGVPVMGDLGNLNITVTATDTGGLSASNNFALSVNAPVIIGTAGNETLNGTIYDDVIYGLAGSDTLNGGAGNNTLDGGTGNDIMYGQNGNDTYIFGRGYGMDSISDYDLTVGNVDAVQWVAGILPTDVTLVRDNANLVATINGTTDKLIIQNWFNSTPYRVEEMRFANGTVWDASYLAATPSNLNGTEGNDNLYGNDNIDIMYGNGGGDRMYSYGGDDTLNGGAG
jgi:Ca2+-binding RTX toxin-like protein